MAYNQRTAGFSLPEDDTNGAVLGAATIGRIGGLTVGSFDLANLSGLNDVVPQDELNFQSDQEVPYKQANVNTYYYAQGTPILRDGKTLAGYYVDTFLGLDWIGITPTCVGNTNTIYSEIVLNIGSPPHAWGIPP